MEILGMIWFPIASQRISADGLFSWACLRRYLNQHFSYLVHCAAMRNGVKLYYRVYPLQVNPALVGNCHCVWLVIDSN